MTKKVAELEKQIRKLALDERTALFEKIDDLYDADWERTSHDAIRAALAIGIDPDDDDAVQGLVSAIRYPGVQLPRK